MQKKRGKFSNEEIDFITKNYKEKSVDSIAQSLNRAPETIHRYLETNGLLENTDSQDVYIRTLLKNKLYSRSYYTEAKQQFNTDELQYFEESWIELLLQFKEDLLFSEELVLKDWLTLNILMTRTLKERKSCEEALINVKKEYAIEFAKGDGIRDAGVLGQLEMRRAGLESSINTYTKDHMSLLGEVKHIVKSLKANRDERIKRVEDSKTSWIGLLRAMQDPSFRESIGEEIELVRLAKDKAKNDLSQLHQYADGRYDRPFLTPETVLEEYDGEESDTTDN